ncbi:hypothetical protein J2Y69_002115 [Microbacterium resistens]|uniref:Uncharacterized protein n=1 Tax=Microbacterium resistens TaxID=156977 RepID=A0ABU1SD25_9MICO|nr:hypothetical protein [Microbacterium resistens]
MSTHVDETLVRLLRQGWRGETATDLMREAAARIEALTSAPDRTNRSEHVLSGQDSGECERGDHEACDGTTPGWECLCSCHPDRPDGGQ